MALNIYSELLQGQSHFTVNIKYSGCIKMPQAVNPINEKTVLSFVHIWLVLF